MAPVINVFHAPNHSALCDVFIGAFIIYLVLTYRPVLIVAYVFNLPCLQVGDFNVFMLKTACKLS